MGAGTGGSICVQEWNDKNGTTMLVAKFRELDRDLKARRVGKIVISGILPVTGGRKGYRNCRRMSNDHHWTETTRQYSDAAWKSVNMKAIVTMNSSLNVSIKWIL